MYWHYGKGRMYYRPIFRLTKLAFFQGQSYTERKYLLLVAWISAFKQFFLIAIVRYIIMLVVKALRLFV